MHMHLSLTIIILQNEAFKILNVHDSIYVTYLLSVIYYIFD